MPVREITVNNIGLVKLYKRRGAKTIKLSITGNGDIRVTLPVWAPYALGQKFVEEKREWLTKHQRPRQILGTNMRIGKAHRLLFFRHQSSNIRTRVTATEIRIYIPKDTDTGDSQAQAAARKACVRALMGEANTLLPIRLAELAGRYGFEYRSVKIKQLKGRWGSCNHHKDIVLNCFLMQLPWELIDYVILHELTHTVVLAHGPPFWQELGKYIKELGRIRKTMRSMQPDFSYKT